MMVKECAGRVCRPVMELHLSVKNTFRKTPWYLNLNRKGIAFHSAVQPSYSQAFS